MSDRKPNPNQLMHKGNLLAHIIEECRTADQDGFLSAQTMSLRWDFPISSHSLFHVWVSVVAGWLQQP